MPTAPRRPRYFSGRLLTAEDFEAEQSYHLEARRRDNRHLHGWGVVSGLGVTPASGGGAVVEPGLAIGGLGRVTLCLAYAERPDDETDPDRFVRETYLLDVRPGRAAASEAREPRGHCVPIATVHRRDGKLSVDLRPRRMLVSTDVLLELIQGLVRRVEELEQRS